MTIILSIKSSMSTIFAKSYSICLESIYWTSNYFYGAFFHYYYWIQGNFLKYFFWSLTSLRLRVLPLPNIEFTLRNSFCRAKFYIDGNNLSDPQTLDNLQISLNISKVS